MQLHRLFLHNSFLPTFNIFVNWRKARIPPIFIRLARKDKGNVSGNFYNWHPLDKIEIVFGVSERIVTFNCSS